MKISTHPRYPIAMQLSHTIWSRLTLTGIQLSITKSTSPLDYKGDVDYIIRALYPGERKSVPCCRISSKGEVVVVFPNDMRPPEFDIRNFVQEYRDEILVAIVMNS